MNSFIKCVLLLVVSVPFPLSAFAGCPPLHGQNRDDAIVGSFVQLATQMGVSCPVSYSANAENHSVTVEYVSAAEKQEAWTKMMTAVVIETGNKPSAATTLALTQNFTRSIQMAGGSAQIIAQTERNAGRNVRGIWYAVKYELGQERNIAVVRTIDEHLAAILQFQQKEISLSEETIETFLSSNGMAKRILR